MRVILDSNEYIFGFDEASGKPECVRLLEVIATLLDEREEFVLFVPEMVREEVHRNLSPPFHPRFYRFIQSDPKIVYGSLFAVQPDLFRKYHQQLGLKLGDATIAAFAEQEQVDVLVSENRDIYEELKVEVFLRCTAQQFLDGLDSGEIWTRVEQLRSSRSA